ncbi:MAG: amidase family protein, partial [Arenicellales bacterium]|nr:amidase family protein [Arenicellales bacterium]
MNSQPSKWSLSKINRALRDGSLTSVELVQDCINNLKPELSAYREWTPEKAVIQAQAADNALAQAKDSGTLQGIPISVKDLYGVDGTQTFAGSPAPMPSPWQSEGDLIKALRQQHSVFTGKTHTVEFAFGGVGINSHWGT